MIVLEARGLGRRYGHKWALRDCTLALPEGRIVALVGPNGAGKSTLLNMAVGLTKPSAGTISVLDGHLPGSEEALNKIGFVAQDAPLYRTFTVADILRTVACLTNSWDEVSARKRLESLDIPLKQRVDNLSGGQHAQVALAVALARHPRLLILDEPVARLDPLARHDFMGTLMAAVAEEGITVLLSSHVVAELERVCDYLVVLSQGSVQVIGDVDELVAGHRILTGPAADIGALASLPVVHEQRAARQARALIRVNGRTSMPTGWEVQPTNLEEIVLSYLRAPNVKALPGPRSQTLTEEVPA